MATSDPPAAATAVAEFVELLARNDRVGAGSLAQSWTAVRPALSFIDDVAVPALDEIGRRWESGQIALAQIYLAGRICEALVDDLLISSGTPRFEHPRVAIASLSDQHTLGKRVVSMVVRSAGYRLVDYGAGVAPDGLAQRAASDQVDVLLLSALMLASALDVEPVVRRLAELKAQTRVVVGGAPFRLDPTLWQRVGAHGSGATATDAVHRLRELGGRS